MTAVGAASEPLPSFEAGLELAKLAQAFRPSTQFFIAARIGLFDQIAEDGSTAAEIAGAVPSLPSPAVMSVLSAQVESGVLCLADDGRFRVREDLRPLLCCGAESVVADLMTFARENDVWLAASSILRNRSEAPLEYRRELLDSRIARYRGIQSLNRIVAFDILSELRQHGVLPPYDDHTQGAVDVLDIGGGDGLYSELLLDRCPEARVCILDLEGGFALDERHTQHLASGRLALQVGDARTFAASRAYDLVIVNELLELFSYSDKVEILKHAFRAVAPNGHLVVTKFALSSDQVTPASSAVFSLRMHFKTASGYLETDDEVVSILNSGVIRAEDVETRSIQQGMKTMIIARRPDGSEHRSESGNGNGNGRETTHLSRDQEPASPAQLELWRQLVSGATSFRPAALLFASAELDLYANIAADGGSTSSEVAERLGMRELSVRLLMNALAAIGLLALDDGRFHVHPELRLLLTEGPHSVVQEVLQYKRENQLWLRLAEILKGGQAERGEGLDQMEAAHLSQYLSAVQLSNRSSAEKLVARLAEPYLLKGATPKKVLDVGGGLGSYTRLLLGVGANVRVTLLDRAQVIEECRRTFTRELESGQLELVPGDALDFKLGARFDLVLMNDLLHYFSDEEKTRIVSNAKNALTPNGLLVVSKFALGETAISPAGAALFSMKVHLKKVDAYLDTDHKTMEIIRGLGFAEVRTEALDESRSLVLGFMSDPA